MFGRERDVRGKVVLITGAARGIGAGVARDLATKGATVALVGLEAEELAKVAADCGPDAGWWEADVTSWDDLEKATAAVVERYGRIDVVLANAGIAATGFTRSIDPAAFERVIDVDLLGVWRTVRVALPHLIESKGYALLVSSLAAIVHIPGNAAYSAAKAGVEAFANSLRAEVRHLGVGVGVVHPTWIATDMVNTADQHPVFGPLRRAGKGLASKTYPLSVAVDLISAGVAKRARVVHVPGWVGVLKVFRAVVPRVVELVARGMVPAADKAALADIEKRGLAESSLVGPGARAAARSSGAL
jgi:NAD(P)-dependent dehydrogenase (short-subunit alcohol dehydrogenase family)